MTNKFRNLVYVVEPEDMLSPECEAAGYVPNFSMQGVELRQNATSKVTGVLASGLSLGIPLLSLPTSLVLAAAISRPLISQLLSNDKGELPPELAKAELAEIEAFMRKYAITPRMAKDFGYIFPPGHPQVGQTYKLHPLAELNNSGKENVYIPQDKYDQLLLEEREAELLKLLVALGATKVSITRKKTHSSSLKSSCELSAEGKLLGEAAVTAALSAQAGSQHLDTRDFELSGKPWKRGDKLDKGDFAWVHFEPSWGALVMAREVGGCTKATLEIRENTSFSSDKQLAAKVKARMYGGGVAGALESTVEAEKVFWIEASFAPFASTAQGNDAPQLTTSN